MTNANDNTQMKIRIGGKVRSIGGVEGKVIAVSDDRRSVMVKVPGTWRGTGIVSIPLVRLKAIEAYTSHDGHNGPFSTPA